METVSPQLFACLIHQRPERQNAIAGKLGTSQSRLSRMVNGKLPVGADDYQAWAPKLALGQHQPHESPLPKWIITRLHVSAMLDVPPLDREGRLPVFASYALAEVVTAYLRLFPTAKLAVPIPVWDAWITQQLRQRGLGRNQVFVADAADDEHGELVGEWMCSLLHGFNLTHGDYLPRS